MNNIVLPRERFLQRAAELISDASPNIADQYRHDASLIRGFKESVSRPVHNGSCPVCGSLRVVSRHAEVKRRWPMRNVAHNVVERSSEASRLHIRKCQRCSRSVKSPVKVSASVASTSIPSIPATKEASTRDKPFNEPVTASTKPSSKKRAKERKDREGLKALLDKSKAKSSGSGFSLMDFMSTDER